MILLLQIMLTFVNLLSGWHKDSGEDYGGYFDGDYFNSDEYMGL